MSQAEDMAAIDTYMRRTNAVTNESRTLQNSWFSWYDGLSWFDRTLNGGIYNEARARRSAFNAANLTPENPRGMTTEEMGTSDVIAQTVGKVLGSITAPVSRVVPTSPGIMPTIRQGSQGEAVKRWQQILGVNADGIFGPLTHSATVKWQANHGLVADGIVGPLTWAKALGEPTPSVAPAPAPVPITTPAPEARIPEGKTSPPSDLALKAQSALLGGQFPLWMKVSAMVGASIALGGVLVGLLSGKKRKGS